MYIKLYCPKCKKKMSVKVLYDGYVCGDCSDTPDLLNAYTVNMLPIDYRKGKRLKRKGLIK